MFGCEQRCSEYGHRGNVGPPKFIQLKENIAFYEQLLRVDSDFWPVISADALIDQFKSTNSKGETPTVRVPGE